MEHHHQSASETTSGMPCGDFLMPSEDLPPAPPETRDPVHVPVRYQAGDQMHCPACNGVHIGRRSWQTGKPVVWWACKDDACGFWWKVPASVMTEKVHVIV
jgi:hypothetical protein